MRVQVNGIGLNVEVWGEGPPVVLLHGFTGRATNWRPIAERWPRLRAVAVDITGHGDSDSPASVERYTAPAFCADLAALLDALGIERAALAGYSMGGRLALQFALGRPERVSALVIESASAGIADAAERAARVASDEALAERIEREGIEAFVDYWQSIPLWESQKLLPESRRAALRAQRLQNSPRGLANSLRGMGAGAQDYVFDRLPGLRLPVLFVAGELDARYAALARSMAALVPGAEVRIIPGAGHATHFERPEAFAEAAGEFLTRFLLSEKVEA
ncbi:MAG TPA: 2-succinyl-6-hydroxy-2,4-cyclohexadiene-1-carboxylate synthase [Dehalococcoidia bacterium]|nr:2-succinyl-6-hydroxy-2,4-cyclohexadiene-1-carboxylate synthase [Dehalococcoidia bacterium]